MRIRFVMIARKKYGILSFLRAYLQMRLSNDYSVGHAARKILAPVISSRKKSNDGRYTVRIRELHSRADRFLRACIPRNKCRARTVPFVIAVLSIGKILDFGSSYGNADANETQQNKILHLHVLISFLLAFNTIEKHLHDAS